MFTDLMECYIHPETQERRYPYCMVGKITTAEDPASSSQFVRVKAQLNGMKDGEETDWLSPIVGGAIEYTPNVGDMAIVWFEDGIPERGYYGVFAVSNSRNRPSEAMALGTTLAAIINANATTVANLITEFNAHIHTGVTVGMGSTGAPASPSTGTVKKVQAADGGVVSDASGNKIALSGKAKVR